MEFVKSKYAKRSNIIFSEQAMGYSLKLDLLMMEAHPLIGELNIIQNVKDFINEVSEKIKSLEKEIAEEKARTVSLLAI